MAVVTWLLIAYLAGVATPVLALRIHSYRRTMTHVDADNGMPTIHLHPKERKPREVSHRTTSVRRVGLPGRSARH